MRYAWEINGTRRPLPPLSKACKEYGFECVRRPQYVPDGHCEWCGKELPKRCSSLCSKECRRLFGMAETWNARGGYAKHILRRDNFTCQDCGEFHAMKNSHGIYIPTSDGELEIHHIKPVAEGGGDEPENLITLCHSCHLKRHEQMRSQADKKVNP